MATAPTDQKNVQQNDSPKKVKKRSIHFIVENESKKNEKTPGVQLWLKQKNLMDKMYNDPNFKSLSSHSRLKKEMTEASSQMKMINWLSDNFDKSIMSSLGSNCLIIDICSGKGFFGVLISHILTKSNIILIDKNKKMNIKHFNSCNNVLFNIVDIRAHKFKLSKWIQNQYKKILKADNNNNKILKLILIGTHLCGELSPVVIDAFNELSDIACCLFLVPCCFPKKDKIINKAKQLNMDTMDYWIQLLQKQVKRTKNDHLLLECIQLNEMLSEKNRLIRCVRKDICKKNLNHTNNNNNNNNDVNDTSINDDNTNINSNTSFRNSNQLSYAPPLKKQKIVR